MWEVYKVFFVVGQMESRLRVSEEAMHGEEALKGIISKLFHLLYDVFDAFLFGEVARFREKFVGIADELFFYAYWQPVAMR